MKTSLHRILTEDGIELVGLLYEPENPPTKILVHVHGMAGNFYENLFQDNIAQTLTFNGIAFCVFNNRGCEFVKDLTKVVDGKRTIARYGDTYERFEDCLLDIKPVIDFAESKGFSDIHLSGHSLASSKVAYYAAEQNDKRIKSVTFLSPADMVGLAKVEPEYKRDIETVEKMVAEGKGEELMPFLVWGECLMTPNTYISIAHESSKVAIFNFYNPNDSFSVLGKITIPSLTVIGRNDYAMTIPIEETMEKIKKAMVNSPKVETTILGDSDHGFHGYEQQLADVINNWIKES